MTDVNADAPIFCHPPIKAGDLLYAIGPAHHALQDAADLKVYSTRVEAVRLLGSFSTTCPPELIATTSFVIELGDHRPYLGFPKWEYQDHEIGIHIHCSRVAALQAFAAQANRRRDQAARELDHANMEVQWALTTMKIDESPEVAP